MEKKNNKDAFADFSLGGGDKYLKRHQDALRMERAEAVDKRIAAFDARKKDLDWAHEAIDFCDRETSANKDIADLSKGVQELPRIKQEAQDILNAHARKVKEENEALIKQQKMQELKTKEDEDNSVRNMENLINNLSNQGRTRYWLDDVEKVNLLMKGFPSKLVDRVSNRFLLESFVKESKDVRDALDLDDKIIELNATRMKNKAWAEKVFECEKKLSSRLDRYMKEKSTLYNIIGYASKIYYSVELNAIESFLKKVESEDLNGAYEEYATASKYVNSMREAIYIDEYIPGFEGRYSEAVDKMKVIEKQINADNKARQKKEEEERKARAIAEENARKQQAIDAENKRKKAIRNARLSKIGLFVGQRLLEIGAIIAVLVFGLNMKNTVTGDYVLGIGFSAITLYLWIRTTIWLRNSEGARMGLFIFLSIVAMIFGACCIFVEPIKNILFPVCGLLGLMSVYTLVFSENVDGGAEDKVGLFSLISILLASVYAGIGCMTLVGGIVGSLIGAGIVVAGTVIMAILKYVFNINDFLLYIFIIPMLIAALVVVWWMNWPMFIFSFGLCAGGCILGFTNDEDEMIAGPICGLVFYLIMAAIVAMIIALV